MMAERWSHDRGERDRLAVNGRRRQALKVHASLAAATGMRVERRADAGMLLAGRGC